MGAGRRSRYLFGRTFRIIPAALRAETGIVNGVPDDLGRHSCFQRQKFGIFGCPFERGRWMSQLWSGLCFQGRITTGTKSLFL
jgi:hypothetical protein